MSQKMFKDLRQIVHPYVFVLKEGQNYHNNCLDYSLMMLHTHCLEVFSSPRLEQSSATVPTALMSNFLFHPPESSDGSSFGLSV